MDFLLVFEGAPRGLLIESNYDRTPKMAKKSVIARSQKKPKFSTRATNRCFKCGRGRAFMSDFGLCRICFRELANDGRIPGVKKSSW
jgi:small subunit ribosomal protein S14